MPERSGSVYRVQRRWPLGMVPSRRAWGEAIGSEGGVLFGAHAALLFWFRVVVAEQVEDAVNGEMCQFVGECTAVFGGLTGGCLHRDDHIAEVQAGIGREDEREVGFTAAVIHAMREQFDLFLRDRLMVRAAEGACRSGHIGEAEGKHVSGRIHAAVLAVEMMYRLVVGKRHRKDRVLAYPFTVQHRERQRPDHIGCKIGLLGFEEYIDGVRHR